MENKHSHIERAVRYIEQNLTRKIDLDLIAREAYYSKYHFLRVFQAFTGLSPAEYTRKRRLTESANSLIHTDRPILSIALEYQFESQESFTRSFRKYYQMTPGAYRKKGLDQVVFHQYSYSEKFIERMKHMNMEPEIRWTDDKTLVGISARTSMNNNKIPGMWQEFLPHIPGIKNRENTDRYLWHPFEPDLKIEEVTDDYEFEKWVAVEVRDDTEIPSHLQCYKAKGGKYAVYIHKGTVKTFTETNAYVFGSLFPKSGLEFDERDDFVRYGEHFLGPMDERSELEIWIPVK